MRERDEAIPRTQDEIIQRIRDRVEADFFGCEVSCYLPALTPESADALRGDVLKPDADLSDWEQSLKTTGDVRKTCIEYMDFAWGKANNCRGISANRSIMHYIAWLWLLGTDEFDDLMDDYELYGKPQLARICEFLGLDASQWDDGVWQN